MSNKYILFYKAKNSQHYFYEFTGQTLDMDIPVIIDLIDKEIDQNGLGVINIKEAFDTYILSKLNYSFNEVNNITSDSKFIIHIDAGISRFMLYRKKLDYIPDPFFMDECKILLTHKFLDT